MGIPKTTKLTLLTTIIALTGGTSCWGATQQEGLPYLPPEIVSNVAKFADDQTLRKMAQAGANQAGHKEYFTKAAAEEHLARRLRFEIVLEQNKGNLGKAFIDAIQTEKVWAIDPLIKAGAEVNRRIYFDGNISATPLIAATIAFNANMVAELIKAPGIDLNATWNGNTALTIARNFDNRKIVDLLERAGATR